MDTERNIIRMKQKDGSIKEAEVILFFGIEDKRFAIYTCNETNDDGMIILYSSMLEKENGEVVFKKIEPEYWLKVKGLMGKIAKEWTE